MGPHGYSPRAGVAAVSHSAALAAAGDPADVDVVRRGEEVLEVGAEVGRWLGSLVRSQRTDPDAVRILVKGGVVDEGAFAAAAKDTSERGRCRQL